MGFQCTIIWYRWDGMDKWDYLTPDGKVWDVPWDPSVPYGTGGMGWTSGTGWLYGVECGTSHGIPSVPYVCAMSHGKIPVDSRWQYWT